MAKNNLYETLQDRLIANSIISTTDFFEGTPCWDWIGKRGGNKNAYPVMNIRVDGKHKQVRAHRVSYEEFIGKKIADGFEINHKCNRPICIAPLHLESCTHSENVKWSYACGRSGKRTASDIVVESATNAATSSD